MASVGIAGALLGAVVAAFASRWFPIGSASMIEPTPGVEVDAVVLAVVVVLALVVVVGLSVWSVQAGPRFENQARQMAAAAGTRGFRSVDGLYTLLDATVDDPER